MIYLDLDELQTKYENEKYRADAYEKFILDWKPCQLCGQSRCRVNDNKNPCRSKKHWKLDKLRFERSE